MKWYNCGPSWLGCFDRSLTAMGARSHLWAPAKPQWIKIMHGFGYVEWTWARDYCMFSFLILTTMLKLITTPFVENRFRDKVTWFLFHGIFPNSNYHPYTVKAYSKYISNNTNPPTPPPSPAPAPIPAPAPPPPPPPRKQPPPKHHYQNATAEVRAKKLGLGNALVGGPAHILSLACRGFPIETYSNFRPWFAQELYTEKLLVNRLFINVKCIIAKRPDCNHHPTLDWLVLFLPLLLWWPSRIIRSQVPEKPGETVHWNCSSLWHTAQLHRSPTIHQPHTSAHYLRPFNICTIQDRFMWKEQGLLLLLGVICWKLWQGCPLFLLLFGFDMVV